MSATDLAPPQDLDAEASVLSALLLDPDRLPELREALRPEQFYSDANRRVYAALCELADRSDRIDLRTVAALLESRQQLAGIGGTAYLAQLSDATPAVAHVDAHAKLVSDRHRQRRAIELCRRYAAEAHGDVGEVEEWLQRLEQAVYGLAEARTTTGGTETLARAVPRALDGLRAIRESGAAPAVSTGWPSLDQLLAGGLRRGHQYVVAGRPGMGKSALGLGVALNVAQAGRAAVVVSCEMPADDLVARAIAVHQDLPVSDILGGGQQPGQWASIMLGAEAIRTLPLALRYCPGATVQTVRSTVRQALQQLRGEGQQVELGVVVVDYLQIMQGQRQRGDSRESEVAELSRQLLYLAGEFAVPTVVLSQLNRGVESRDCKRPRLSDLRDSGAIEQDASAVALLYRDEYYDRHSARPGQLDVEIAKNRNGPTGTATLRFIGESTQITEIPASEQAEDMFGRYD